MAEKRHVLSADWLGLVSIGFFAILVGTIVVLNSNLVEATIDFGKDFHVQNVTGNVGLPAPEHVYDHKIVYNAIMQFGIIFGVFEIVVLILRFAFRESTDRKADALSGMALWFSVGYFSSLLANESIGWFGFVAGLVISVGLAIVVSSLVKLFK